MTRKAPEQWATEARAAEDAGDYANARALWMNAGYASYGEGRRERYFNASERCRKLNIDQVIERAEAEGQPAAKGAN